MQLEAKFWDKFFVIVDVVVAAKIPMASKLPKLV